ncbi:hypothetical protein PT974_09478 [Cladobotryum mycophilum]|uniref:Transcription factor domain-containing protein n=1 Tax=Cladobotryum mycophilum TaxID=491253 RepID=A0ABR0SHG6_9HYPO
MSEPDRTFVNLTDDPAQGRSARRIYVRRAVMKNYHKRRRQQTGGQREPATTSYPEPIVAHPVTLQMHQFYPFEPRTSHISQMSRVVIQFLCGQITKAAQDVTYVPFIHRLFAEGILRADAQDSQDSHSAPKINSLKQCQLLLQEHGFQDEATDVSQSVLWSKVHEHQEWIYAQHESFDKWELLSAAQAITLYLLLRMKLGRNHVKFPYGDIALLFTLGRIFRIIQISHLNPIYASGHPPDWENWIFCESCFRTATVYFILTVFFSMDIGLPCDSPSDWKMDDLPVPATKGLWSAGDAANWARSSSTPYLPRQLKLGDLLPSNRLPQLPIETWKESTDEMGLLVAMAMDLRIATSEE